MTGHDPIREKTFARWCNEHLKVKKEVIHDLDTDLRDGKKLIKLLTILTGKKVAKCSRIPVPNSQISISNVKVALDFIRKETDIDLVNISK